MTSMASKDLTKTRKKSKSSFFDIFSRPKVERARGAREAPAADLPIRRTSTLKKLSPEAKLDARPTTQPNGHLKRPKSAKSLKTSKKPDDQLHGRVEPPFEAPPLFQAYPQAIRHTILEAPSSSHGPNDPDAETEFGDDINPAQDRAQSTSAHRVLERFKARRKVKHARAAQATPGDVSTPSWSQKIYILVTTGYLLEYSGQGPYDRLPEKMLKLTQNSAAFASDAIEGKHWVLQVVQEAKGGYVNQAIPKTFMAKVGFQGNRRVVSTMLLVFGAPEDMDQWMTALRREVESMGGTSPVKYTQTQDDEVVHECYDVASHRRYSGIIRQPSVRSSEPLSPTLSSSCTDTSTIVASGRTSGTTAVGSSVYSSSRSSKALPPALLLPVTENMQYTEDGYGLYLGPAISTPSFFEREPSPVRFDFPQSPTAISFGSGGSAKGHAVPRALQTVFELPTQSLYQRHSSQSISSQASSPAPEPEPEPEDDSIQSLRQRYSSLSSHPLPVRVHLASDHADRAQSETSFESSDRSTSLLLWPAPPQAQAETQDRPVLIRNSSMDPISESPPITPSSATRPGRRPTPLKLGSNNSSTSLSATSKHNYTNRSSLAPPGESSADRAITSRQAKRTSVFNKPMPVRPSPPQSNRVSYQAPSSPKTAIFTSKTGSGNSSPLASPSGRYFTPPSSAGLTPIPTAILNDPSDKEKAFSRPSSFQLSQNLTLPSERIGRSIAPSTTPATNPTPGTSTPAKQDIRQSASAPVLRERHVSSQVPVIRPPIRSSLLRSRASANILTKSLPPPLNPPPNAPLPATPSPTSAPLAPPLATATAVMA